MLDLLLIQQNDQDFRGMTNVCGISRLISIGDALTRKAASSGNHSELEFPMYNVTHGTTARFSTNFEFSRRIFYGEESLEA